MQMHTDVSYMHAFRWPCIGGAARGWEHDRRTPSLQPLTDTAEMLTLNIKKHHLPSVDTSPASSKPRKCIPQREVTH